jgi:hypothetical protein
MSTPTKPNNEFEAIALEALQNVAGGAARSSKGDSELTAMLTSITSSIKDLANNQNQGQDPMQMILMMMMMGGFGGGGGGGGYIAAPAAATPPVINVDTGVSGGGFGGGCGRGKGKKGW